VTIPGIGAAKLERYGSDVLSLVHGETAKKRLPGETAST
jgi:hypothetical protein